MPIVARRWLPGELGALSRTWMFGNAPLCLQDCVVNPGPSRRVTSLNINAGIYPPTVATCSFAIACLLQGCRHQKALRLCFIRGTGNTQTSETLACTVGACLPVSRLDSLSISVIFDQSCRRSQRMWWTDASLSPRCRCLCSVRSPTKKLTGRYWFSLFRESLYTWRPERGHRSSILTCFKGL